MWPIRNTALDRPEPVCYVLRPETCTDEQFESVENGTAIVEDWIGIGVETKTEESVLGLGDSVMQYLLEKQDL